MDCFVLDDVEGLEFFVQHISQQVMSTGASLDGNQTLHKISHTFEKYFSS